MRTAPLRPAPLALLLVLGLALGVFIGSLIWAL
jgi:hypothetical protein